MYLSACLVLGIKLFRLLYQKSRWCQWGSRSRVCPRLTLRSAPHQHQRNVFAISGNSNHFSFFLRKKMLSLQNFRSLEQHLLRTFIFFQKRCPPIWFYSKSYFAQFQNPRTTPFGRKLCYLEERRKTKKKIKKKYSGHYFPLQCPRAAHALRSDQKHSYVIC